MTEIGELPDGWEVWNDEPDGRVIFVYRPDVFDGGTFPPACLPTLSVSPSSPDRPPGETSPEGNWFVTFYLEPDVRARDQGGHYDSRGAAVDGARAVALRFTTGKIDVRSYYQVPRDEYLAELETLTGREA